MPKSIETDIILTGDGQTDGDAIVQMLDDYTQELVPLENYAEYLKTIARSFSERARQVEDEVG